MQNYTKPYKVRYTIYGKTFAVVHKTHYSLENFRGASGPYYYVLYTVNDSRGKLSRLAKNRESFPPSKVLPYTVLLLHVRFFKHITNVILVVWWSDLYSKY